MGPTPIDRILAAFRDHGLTVTRTASGHKAQCPTHQDRKPSVKIDPAHNGGVVLYCHAGCPTEQVMADLGLTLLDLQPPDRDSHDRDNWVPCTRDGHSLAAEYPYRDEAGIHLYTVVRCTSKCFRQWAPDPAKPGQKRWRVDGIRRIPYRLPQLAQAIADQQTIYICEGEKDVHTAVDHGLAATCNPGGAGKWKPEYNQHLAGAHVIIVADQDLPGYRHAWQVHDQLAPIAASVRVAQPATGKDLTDHIAAGHTIDQLLPLARDTPPPTPPGDQTNPTPEPEPEPEPDQPDPTSNHWYTRARPGGAFILDTNDTPPAIWGDGTNVAWAEGEALMLCGPAGVGKTTVALQLVAARIGIGPLELFGLPIVPGEKRTLFLAMDRPAQLARAAGRLFNEDHRKHLDEQLVIWPGPPPYDMAKHPEVLLALCRHADADTVIVDSLKDAAIGLSDDAVGAGYNRARQGALAAGIQVMELHHQRKANGDNKTPSKLDDVYGSTWLTAGAGSVFILWGEAGDPEISMLHVKQPSEQLGPWMVQHDHATGLSTLHEQVDLLALVRYQGQVGMSAQLAAQRLYRTENPSRAEVAKARRRLDGMVRAGLLVTRSNGQAGQTAYFLALPGGQ